MALQADLVCLANSRKHGGRCVAGIALPSGDWIRPVSSHADGTLSRLHYLLEDGTEPSVLDVVHMELERPRPELHQPENWLLSGQKWQRRAKLSVSDAVRLLETHASRTPGPELLGSRTDRVHVHDLAARVGVASLALVEPAQMEWHITRSMTGSRQTRVVFELGGALYDLSVTDPVWEARLASLPFGLHDLGAAGIKAAARVFLTVSLAEPFHGDCYKLVAAVIVLD